jgi:hypothetical protein
MTSWVDGPDWDEKRGYELAQLLGSQYREDAVIEPLLPACGISAGLLPIIKVPQDKWFAFAKDLHSKGKLGCLLKVIAEDKRALRDKLAELTDGFVTSGAVERPDDGSYRNMRRRYLRWARNEWRYIDLGNLGLELDAEHTDRLRRLPLDSMYISLQAEPRSLTAGRGGGSRATADTGSHGGGGTSLEDAYARHRILVVLGNPGSGKSVMCLWLGSELARQSLNELNADKSAQVRVPMKFRVADYATFYAAQSTNGVQPGGICEFLARELPRNIGYTAVQLQGMFERALTDGEADLLIDGLDELADHREEVIDALVAAVNSHLDADHRGTDKVVITSRIAGYEDIRLTAEESATYVIRPMSDEQCRSFAERFFQEIGADDQAPLLLRHLAESDEAIRRLARTPLLLTSICSYWHRHRRLPTSRAKLYWQLVVDTGYRWRDFAAADGRSSLDDVFRAQTDSVPNFLVMLSRVAFRIHEEHADGQIDEDELLETLDEALFGLRRLTDVDPRQIGPELIDRIRQRVGIFAEIAPGQFGFIHPTFREYLAGLDLLNRSGEPNHPNAASDEKLFDELAQRISDPRWREPILLALGECNAATRIALLDQAIRQPELFPEWADIFLAGALERPAVGGGEGGKLLALAVKTYNAINATVDLREDLEAQIAELRRHLKHDRFDYLALSLLDDDPLLAPAVAALYWRRRWLTSQALATFAALAHRDSADWDWPIQRALRRAAGPEPLLEPTILSELKRPSDDDSESFRLYELGRRSWELHRQRNDEAVVGPLPAGVLPVRELFIDHPDRWTACVANTDIERVLCALFGGLDHHDAVHWSAEFEEFEWLLQLPDSQRKFEIERRATQLVPRFDPAEVTLDMAVMLDTVGGKVTRSTPEPVVDVAWMTCPSTDGMHNAVLHWLNRDSGDPAGLRRALEQLAAPGSAPFDRAEAELGLLVLDGRPMTPDRESERALLRVLESAGDAAIRDHSIWLEAIWADETPATDAERAVLHRFLLRIAFQVSGRPVPLRPDPLSLSGESAADRMHPVLVGDRLARLILARVWGQEEPDHLGVTEMPPERLLAALAWQTTLPYGDTTLRPALWHEAMPRAMAAVPGGLESMLQPLLTWTHRQAPHLEPQLSTAVRAALSPNREQHAEPLPAYLRELYRRLSAGRHLLEPDVLEKVRRCAEELPGPYTDVAYLLIELSRQVPQQQPELQRFALDLLAAEPDEGQLAEALNRIRGHLCQDEGVREATRQLVDRIGSRVLRAEAEGDLAETAKALVELAGSKAGPAARISLLIVVRAWSELSRITSSARYDNESVVRHDAFGIADAPNRTHTLYPPLTLDALATIDQYLTSSSYDGEKLAQWLSCVREVEESAVGGLTELVERAAPGEPWTSAARNLLCLHRITVGTSKGGEFRELVDMICTADAATAAKANLLLSGEFGTASRDFRLRRLSECGLDGWWELGSDAATEADPLRKRLFRWAMMEWDVDDAAAVREAANRSSHDEQRRAVWLGLLETMAIWREEAQLALAVWLEGLTTDHAAACAALNLVAMLHTAQNELTVTEKLVTATIRLCVDSELEVRTVSGLTTSAYRLGVAQNVADACLDAMRVCAADAPTVSAARRYFGEHTEAVLDTVENGSPRADFDGYGQLFWVPSDARPADAARFVPEELNNEQAIGVLLGWLRELDAEGVGRDSRSRLDEVTFEAILNMLVVLSARKHEVFRDCCSPQLMQPIFSRAAIQMSALAQVAGLIVLGRMTSVDLDPAEGPNLIEVMDAALHSAPEVRAAATEFPKIAGTLQGKVLPDAVLQRIAECPNESVVQGFAGLAAAYLRSPACSHRDRRRIRSALQADITAVGGRRSIYLVGVGIPEDPIIPIIGADRRSEFRRLLRWADSPIESSTQADWRL